MPRILRHKVLHFPLPNLLPVLPPSFIENARVKHKDTLIANPNPKGSSRSKKIKGNRPSVVPPNNGVGDEDVKKEDEDEDERARRDTGSGSMEVDEIEAGSTVGSTGMINGAGHNGDSTADVDQELEEALKEVPVTDLPAPNEGELLEYFRGQEQGRAVNGSGGSGPSSSRAEEALTGVTKEKEREKDKDKEWKEPEVFYIKETGEIFLDYE